MPNISLNALRIFAQERLDEVSTSVQTIKFSAESRTKSFEPDQLITNSLSDDVDFQSLPHAGGIGAWAAVVSVDLRGSTRLADSLGPRDTFRMMHTLLPTLAHCFQRMGGQNLNLRGDGMLTGFGLTKILRDEDLPEPRQIDSFNNDAISAGIKAINCVKDAVEPVIRSGGILADLNVGVGIVCGRITVTRIGWKSTEELTAYGGAVNRASHLSGGHNKVRVSERVQQSIPVADNPFDASVSIDQISGGFELTQIRNTTLLNG